MSLYQISIQEMSQSTTWVVQNRLRSLVVSLNLGLSEVISLVTTFETTLVATGSKVETYHHLLQLVAVHVYPALQSMQATVLPVKF